MTGVSYRQQTLESSNPIARFAHRSRLARSVRKANALLPDGGTLLDFGCGVGDFLSALRALRPDAALLGFDPFQGKPSQDFLHVSDTAAVRPWSVDMLCAFEVLEHLTDAELESFELEASRLLKPGAALVVSVPIIGGPTLLLKEANRFRMFRRIEYSAPELFAAAFLGKPAERASDRKTSHKGFDFQATRAALSRSFALGKSELCPFPALPWWCNSQVFWTFTR